MVLYFDGKEETIMSYGRDFKAYYPNTMGSTDLQIPTKEGKEYTLESLPKRRKHLKFGYYRCEITCKKDDFRKLFSFNPRKIYTHYDLRVAFKHQTKYNIKMDLIQDSQPNAYLYDNVNLIEAKELFGEWFKEVDKLKILFPKNKLVKLLSTRLWGVLSALNTLSKTYEECEEENYNAI